MIIRDSIVCQLVAAWMTGEKYHIVTWKTDDGKTHAKSVHGCEDAEEAIAYALSL